MGETYISCDIEASGPIPGIYYMTALGASVVGEEDKTFYSELEPPEDGIELEKAMSVGVNIEGKSFTRDYLLKNGENPAHAMHRFGHWVNDVAGPDNRPVFVAFNAPFDWQFVNYNFHRYTGSNPFGIRALDIKAYIMGQRKCTWSETSKRSLPKSTVVKSERQHKADDDAVAQAYIFKKFLEQ